MRIWPSGHAFAPLHDAFDLEPAVFVLKRGHLKHSNDRAFAEYLPAGHRVHCASPTLSLSFGSRNCPARQLTQLSKPPLWTTAAPDLHLRLGGGVPVGAAVVPRSTVGAGVGLSLVLSSLHDVREAVDHLPAEHLMHCRLGICVIGSLMNLPSGHWIHAPCRSYMPGSHATQWSMPVPASVLCLPAAQLSGADVVTGALVEVNDASSGAGLFEVQSSGDLLPSPFVNFMATGHFMHVCSPGFGWYCPIWHSRHSCAGPVTEYLPLPHWRHVPVARLWYVPAGQSAPRPAATARHSSTSLADILE